MGGPQQVGDVVHGRTGQQGEQLRLYLEKFSAERTVVRHAVTGQPPVRGVVGPGRQQVGIAEQCLPLALLSRSLCCPARLRAPPASPSPFTGASFPPRSFLARQSSRRRRPLARGEATALSLDRCKTIPSPSGTVSPSRAVPPAGSRPWDHADLSSCRAFPASVVPCLAETNAVSR